MEKWSLFHHLGGSFLSVTHEDPPPAPHSGALPHHPQTCFSPSTEDLQLQLSVPAPLRGCREIFFINLRADRIKKIWVYLFTVAIPMAPFLSLLFLWDCCILPSHIPLLGFTVFFFSAGSACRNALVWCLESHWI